MKTKLLNNFINDRKGQSLLLIIIVLFIVFFLVVSVSENISIDTINTVQNQRFQQAFTAAESGLSAAKSYIKAHPGMLTATGNGTVGNNGGTYNYTITAQMTLNQQIQKDQTVQVSLAGSTSTQVKFNDTTSALLVNVTYTNNTNMMCIYYPQGLTISGVNFATFTQSSANCGGGPMIPTANYAGNGNYWAVTLNTTGGDFLRATLINTTGHPSNIIINPGTNVIQQYQITPIGVSNGSRSGLVSYLSVWGAPPHLFDYVLFNGGQNKTITF